jgi:PAS domain S-box-containing protein
LLICSEYPHDEYVGHNIADFHADQDVIGDILRRLQAGEELRDYVARLRRKDGSIRDVLIHSSVMREEGRFVHTRCFTRDITEQRRAAEALQDSERRFRSLAESAPVGIFQTDAEGNCLFVNEKWCKLAGMSPETAQGQGWVQALHPDDRERVQREWSTAALVGREFAGEYRFRTPQGEVSWLQGNAVVLRTEANQVAGYLGTITDLTEGKRAEQSLRESEQRFARFMQHLPGLAWVKDLRGRYVYANDAAEKAFRTARAQLYGKTDEQVFDPDTAARFKENDQRALASGAGVQVVETQEQGDGVLHHSLVSKFPILGPDGQAALVGGMAIDITDRVRAEGELRRHKERLELAQHAGRIGTFEWNIRTDDVEWSATEEEIFGLPAGGFGGRLENWKQAVHPDDQERAVADCLRAVADRADLDTHFRIVRPDGQIRWITAQGRVFCDGEGQQLRMVGVNIDVTERKAAEEALKEADRLKDEFLAMLAHELRNPLRSRQEVAVKAASRTALPKLPEMLSSRTSRSPARASDVILLRISSWSEQ